MNRLVFIITLIAAGLIHPRARAEAPPPTECFSTPEAVYEAHPGSRAVYTTHATWWTESPKCWFVGKPIAKPAAKPRTAAAVAPAPPRQMAQSHPVEAHSAEAHSAEVKRDRPPANEKNAAGQGTYEEVTAWLRTLMFGAADDTPADFETRFSAIMTTPPAFSYSYWR
jgi:hypothetical protein